MYLKLDSNTISLEERLITNVWTQKTISLSTQYYFMFHKLFLSN